MSRGANKAASHVTRPAPKKTGPTAKRLALAAEVKRMREQGMVFREIGEILGIGQGYANTLYHDPEGAKDRARKETYKGVCAECGGPTSGSGGKLNPSKRCWNCQQEYIRSQEYSATKTFWTKERIIDAIRWWVEEHGEPPSVTDWNPYELSVKFGGGPRARYAQKLHRQKKIPWFSTVVRKFGTWNNAIEAAGFKTRRAAFPGPGKTRTFRNGIPQRRK